MSSCTCIDVDHCMQQRTSVQLATLALLARATPAGWRH